MNGEKPEPTVNLVAFGIACGVSSAILLLYAADYLFLRLGKAEDIFKSVKVHIPPVTRFAFDWGIATWGVLLIATVVSVDQAFRRAGERRTLLINGIVLVAVMGFVFIVRQAFWQPWIDLLSGIGGA